MFYHIYIHNFQIVEIDFPADSAIHVDVEEEEEDIFDKENAWNDLGIDIFLSEDNAQQTNDVGTAN